jgi:hypothetical protein
VTVDGLHLTMVPVYKQLCYDPPNNAERKKGGNDNEVPTTTTTAALVGISFRKNRLSWMSLTWGFVAKKEEQDQAVGCCSGSDKYSMQSSKMARPFGSSPWHGT